MQGYSGRPSGIGAVVSAALLLASSATVAFAQSGDDALTVYATTGYLADAVANVAPEAEIITMVGPGGDPHTYQPSTQDIETIQNADVVVWTGLHLEAQMDDLLESLGDQQVAVGDLLPEDLLLDWPETDDEGNPLHDPHVWNSPEAWSLIVGYIADKLGEIDPDGAADYTANAEAYIAEIAAAAEEAEGLLSVIPEGSRFLITGHDAFNYFGDTYDIEVYATDFVSSEATMSPREMSELAQLIVDNRVPVIFQDNLANPQAITSLQEAVSALDWQVEVSDTELFADSLGAEPGVDTYLGVFRHNARTVAEALGAGS